jgi:alpha-beta hydrolase superfamily lysophospholipase
LDPQWAWRTMKRCVLLPAGPPAVHGSRPGDVLLVPGYGGSTTALDQLAGKITAAGGRATVHDLGRHQDPRETVARGARRSTDPFRPGTR